MLNNKTFNFSKKNNENLLYQTIHFSKTNCTLYPLTGLILIGQCIAILEGVTDRLTEVTILYID